MQTSAPRVYVPRNLALFALAGHVGGAAVFGLAGIAVLGEFAQWAAFAGAALSGAFGVVIGAAVVRVDETDVPGRELRPPVLPWSAIALGTVLSVVVTACSVAASLGTSGFLDASPCFGDRVDTLLPLQYTCLDADGPVALLRPELIALTVIAFAGAAAIVWGQIGLWRARAASDGPRADRAGRILAGVVAAFLALDGTLGVVVLLGG